MSRPSWPPSCSWPPSPSRLPTRRATGRAPSRLPGQALNVKVDLVAAGGGWAGTIDIPQQGAKGLGLTGIRAVGDSLVFAIDAIPGNPLSGA